MTLCITGTYIVEQGVRHVHMVNTSGHVRLIR